MNRSMSRKQIIQSNEVSTLYTFSLGGYPQKVLIEGKYKTLPVVITLHGGPGTPIPFSVGCRGLFPDFTDRFLMVYWDQLGCGINNAPLDESFSIHSFVEMTLDLIREVKSLFPENKIFLFGTSWGSVLTAKVLEASPHIVNGVLANGQIIKEIFFSQEVLDTLTDAGIPQGKLEQIRKANALNFTPDDMQTISSCLRKYTDAYQNRKGKQVSFFPILQGLIASPDYKMKDVKAITINGYLKNRSLWKELVLINLSDILASVEIPYHILQGDTDIVASTKEVQKLVAAAQNPNLHCEVIPDTGHLPGEELMSATLQKLTELAKICSP